jgi:class 3 adenylate cyclase
MLFTDIEGSTPLAHKLDDKYGAVLEAQRRLLRRAVEEAGGREVDCRADEFFAVFQRAADAVTAAVTAQRLLAEHSWPPDCRVLVRMGLHSGQPAVVGEAYVGVDVHHAARVCAAGHGGQIVLSQASRELLPASVVVEELGSYSLAGLPAAERLFQVLAPELRSEFPPLRAARSEGRRMRIPRRTRPPTFAEVAWQVAQLLPHTDSSMRPSMADLGAALFRADRALTGVDEFLERVDRKRLTERLAEQRNLAVISPGARSEAALLEARIASVDRLTDQHQALIHLAAELPDSVRRLSGERETAELGAQVVSTTDALDKALAQTARLLDPLSYKLSRTRYRGIYRTGHNYVVPFVDTLGRDRRQEFDTLAQARDFRDGLRSTEGAAIYSNQPGVHYALGEVARIETQDKGSEPWIRR